MGASWGYPPAACPPLATREALFPGIVSYDETVIPQIVNAILGGGKLATV